MDPKIVGNFGTFLKAYNKLLCQSTGHYFQNFPFSLKGKGDYGMGDLCLVVVAISYSIIPQNIYFISTRRIFWKAEYFLLEPIAEV